MTRILIVDDKPENLYMLRALLQGHACQVDEARHGAEALVKARLLPPQLIISDLLMPVMDGYTLLRHWKADERLRAVPFVVYTATYTGPKDEQLALDLGADAFILKPSEPEPFMVRVFEVLAEQTRPEPIPPHTPLAAEETVLKEYSEALIRKLEEKSLQLERTNRELLEDITRRKFAEAQAQQLLAETVRGRSALLSILEDQRRVEAIVREKEHLLAESQRIAHIGSWTYEMSGKIVWSDETYRLLGVSPDTFTPTLESVVTLCHADDLPAIRAWTAATLAGQPPGPLEFCLNQPDGSLRFLSGRGELSYDEQNRPSHITGTVQDITEQKQAEKSLRDSQKLYRQLFDVSPDAMFMISATGRILDANVTAITRYGYTHEEFLNLTVVELAAHDMAPQSASRLREALNRGHHFECRHRRKDGREFPVEFATEPFTFTGQRAVLSSVRDVTERKQASEDLKASRERLEVLSRQLIAAQETERRHLARELHDEIGQSLTAIKLSLNALQQPTPPLPPTTLIHNTIDVVDKTLQQVRDMALDLRPSILDDLGLVAALRWCLNRQSQLAGLDSRIEVENFTGGASSEIETACFRIAQESLTNIVRYAKASHVRVELRQQDSELNLTVQDNGIGFDVATARLRAAHGGSIGLLGMSERAELLGGQLEIESLPSHGTTIHARFPLEIHSHEMETPVAIRHDSAARR